MTSGPSWQRCPAANTRAAAARHFPHARARGGGQKPFVSKSIQNNCWLNAGGDLLRRALRGASPSSCSASPCIFTPNTPAKWMTPSLNLIHSQGVCSAACKHHLSAPWANNFFAFGKMCSHRACKASSKVCGECINTTKLGQSNKSTIAKHGQTEAKTCELISLHGCTLARLRNFVFLLRFAAGVCSSSLFYIVALFDQTSFAKLLSVGLFCCERNPSHVVYLIWKRI